MSGWLDKRGGLEATKVRLLLLCWDRLLVATYVYNFSLTEMEKKMVYT